MNPVLRSCWEWSSPIDSGGYGCLVIDNKIIRATHLSWFIYKDISTQPSEQICHLCNYKRCVNPQHLYTATASDNMRYAAYCGNITGQKITKNIAVQIRKEYKEGRGTGELASIYHLDRKQIYNIVNNRSWHE